MKRAYGSVLLAALSLRLLICARPLDVLDALFVPDDTYYTLAIARSMANGLGPTVDGTVLTNGFQPLLAFITVPIFWLTRDVDVALRFVIAAMALVDACVALLIGRVGERLGGRATGLLAAWCWALSPVAIANALGGLETALATAMELSLVLASIAAARAAVGTAQARTAYVGFGVLAGLCLLTRVDSVFLVALVGLLHARDGRLRELALVTVPAALAVTAPWWGYSLLRFGTVVPESGAGVRQIVVLHGEIYLQVLTQMGWAVGSLIGPPFAELQALQDALGHAPGLTSALFVCVFAVAAIAAARLVPRRGPEAAIAALLAFGALIVVFYTFYLPALWFFRRYLAPAHVALTLLIAAGLAQAWARRGRVRAVPVLLGVVTALALGSALHSSAQYLWLTPGTTLDEGLHGAKGYRAAAREVLAMLPPGARLGSFQSGALAYYAPAGVEVVNLDGVVDGHARAAIGRRAVADYAHERKLTHFADWAFNTALLKGLSQSAAHDFTLRSLGHARAQGPDRFGVFAVQWAP